MVSKPGQVSNAKEITEIEASVGKELEKILSDFSHRFDCLISWISLELRSLLFPEVQFLRTDEMFITLVNQSMGDFIRLAMHLLGLRCTALS